MSVFLYLTFLLCVGVSSGLNSCPYNGRTYTNGEQFLDVNQCNNCICVNGTIACTQQYCPPQGLNSCSYNGQAYTNGESFRNVDGCNTCICVNGTTACTEMFCPPKTCSYNSNMYNSGDKFPSVDGCNTCTCMNGTVGCTEMMCPPQPTAVQPNALGTCSYGGQMYRTGDKFRSVDGCNTCICVNGTVGCTEMMCPTLPPTVQQNALGTCSYGGQMYRTGDKFRSVDGCNTCICVNGTVGCTEMMCPTLPPTVQQNALGTCSYGGQMYRTGDKFRSVDGCNTCICVNGTVGCTEMKCPTLPPTTVQQNALSTCSYGGKVYSNGEKFQFTDSCITCTCANRTVSCTQEQCHIQLGVIQSNMINSCEYNGVHYHDGESFAAGDGCNFCRCSNMAIACTVDLCDLNASPCSYFGVVHKHGAAFKARDGCNTCRCANGMIACTKMFCRSTTLTPPV